MMTRPVVAFGDYGIHGNIVCLGVNRRHVPELMTNAHGNGRRLHGRERTIVISAAIAQPMKIPVEAEHGDEEQCRLHQVSAARARNRPGSIFGHPHIRSPGPERQGLSGRLDDWQGHLDFLSHPSVRERPQVNLPWSRPVESDALMTLGQTGHLQLPDDSCSRIRPGVGRQSFSSGAKSPSLLVSPVSDVLRAGWPRGVGIGQAITAVIGIDLVQVTRR